MHPIAAGRKRPRGRGHSSATHGTLFALIHGSYFARPNPSDRRRPRQCRRANTGPFVVIAMINFNGLLSAPAPSPSSSTERENPDGRRRLRNGISHRWLDDRNKREKRNFFLVCFKKKWTSHTDLYIHIKHVSRIVGGDKLIKQMPSFLQLLLFLSSVAIVWYFHRKIRVCWKFRKSFRFIGKYN